MTGFGEAHAQRDHLAVMVEVRTINNRFFKLSVRASEGYGSLESLIESEVRRTVHRGTIQVNLRVDRRHSPDDYRLNLDVLQRYQQQLSTLLGKNASTAQQTVAPRIESLLPLPGVVEDASNQSVDAMNDWPLICGVLQESLAKLGQMRVAEGQAMAADLAINCRAATASLQQIEHRAPLVVEEYRNRLLERLKRTLAEMNVSLDPAAVIREVSLFADRSDISEEIVRLRSHLEQFQGTMESDECAGRKLDFLTQEMFRETNTIGSKANDVEITRCVIEIKTVVERIREMIQNIE